MKKIISTLLVCVLLAASLFALASCGNKLSGKYEGAVLSFEFSGDEVTVSAGSVSIKANYEITEEDDDRFITFTFPEDADIPTAMKSLKGKLPFSEGNDDDGKYITILGFKYYKK